MTDMKLTYTTSKCGRIINARHEETGLTAGLKVSTGAADTSEARQELVRMIKRSAARKGIAV